MSMGATQVHGRYEVLVKKILGGVLFIAAGFLLARIQLLSSISPFGTAFVAACFLAKRQEALLAAAGVCLGSLLVPESTLYIVTVTLILCTELLLMGARKMKRWVALLSAVCAYAAGAVIFKTQDIYTLMMAVLECLIALIMIYVLCTLLQILMTRKKRSVFSTEETICLALGALIIVCIFGPVNIYGVYIANIIALFLVLSVAYTGGAALGAGVGLALGMALCLGISAEVTCIGMLGISGMVAGTIRKLKKGGTAIGYILINLLFIIAFFNTAVWYLVLIEVAVAALLFIALPKKILMFAGRYFDVQTRREYEYALHSERFKELTVGRLKEVSEVFLQTGEMFSKEAAEKMQTNVSITGALSVVAETTCKDCVFKKSCWDNDFMGTYNVFCRLFSIYEKNGALEEQHVEEAFAKKCFNIKGILSTAESVFGAYLLNAKWQKKIDESRLVTGKQLKGVARVVRDIGREMDTGFQFLEAVEQRITVSLDAAGIYAREVCAESAAGGGISVGLKVKNCGGAYHCWPGVEKAVSRACGVRMKRVRDTACSQNKFCTLRFEQARKFGVLTGIAMAAKHEVSGDSHSFQGLRDGRYMLMLCDGMGSGESARSESAAAVSLIENFYQAGFNDSIIFDTINRLLILKGNEDVFSTVDLCMLDLKTGSAKFTKIGAECSYILGGGVTTITPGSLPIGILDEVAPLSSHKNLVAGDMIVMMSDGVADTVNKDADEWFSDIPKENAQETADAILGKALGDHTPADDMTVMVTKIIDG
ncbi:MAG: stage II sporulation protein E [Eubacteriales bacterium]|nr:stage II sporulation protein E [Eubacteriales bacterium]